MLRLTSLAPDIIEAILRGDVPEGVYLAGEMLDLDGPCGGFKLQWAFASGWRAGKSAARR